jgi:hypothetical protein
VNSNIHDGPFGEEEQHLPRVLHSALDAHRPEPGKLAQAALETARARKARRLALVDHRGGQPETSLIAIVVAGVSILMLFNGVGVSTILAAAIFVTYLAVQAMRLLRAAELARAHGTTHEVLLRMALRGLRRSATPSGGAYDGDNSGTQS